MKVFGTNLIAAAIMFCIVGGTACWAAPPLGDNANISGHSIHVIRPDEDHFRIEIDGKTVVSGDGTASLQGPYSGSGHTYVLVEEATGGTACEAMFQAIDLAGASPVVSQVLGNCSANPKIEVAAGTLRMAFPQSGDASSKLEQFSGSPPNRTASSDAAPSAPGSPEAFLRGIYAGYASEPGPGSPDPTGASAPEIFDPQLVKLIARARAAIASGASNLLDSDPICDCQDFDHLKIKSIQVTLRGSGIATAHVTFTNSGQQQEVDFQLAKVDGKWRVHDLANSLTKSFRQHLVGGLTKQSKAKKS